MDATLLRCVQGLAPALPAFTCTPLGPRLAANHSVQLRCYSAQVRTSTLLATTASMCAGSRPLPTNWWLMSRSRMQVRTCTVHRGAAGSELCITGVWHEESEPSNRC